MSRSAEKSELVQRSTASLWTWTAGPSAGQRVETTDACACVVSQAGYEKVWCHHLGHAVVDDEPHNVAAVVPERRLRKVRDRVREQVWRHVADCQAPVCRSVRLTGHLHTDAIGDGSVTGDAASDHLKGTALQDGCEQQEQTVNSTSHSLAAASGCGVPQRLCPRPRALRTPLDPPPGICNSAPAACSDLQYEQSRNIAGCAGGPNPPMTRCCKIMQQCAPVA